MYSYKTTIIIMMQNIILYNVMVTTMNTLLKSSFVIHNDTSFLYLFTCNVQKLKLWKILR